MPVFVPMYCYTVLYSGKGSSFKRDGQLAVRRVLPRCKVPVSRFRDHRPLCCSCESDKICEHRHCKILSGENSQQSRQRWAGGKTNNWQ